MKKSKFILPLAVTGILTTSITGTTLAATPLGLFEKGELVEDTAVATFMLENKKDEITAETLKKTYPTITEIKENENGIVGTGTTFKIEDHPYTTLIYGDVNGDGKVTTADAVLVQLNVVHEKELTKTQQEAGNVNRGVDSKLTTTDAVNIQLNIAEGKKIPDIDPHNISEDYICGLRVERTSGTEAKVSFINSTGFFNAYYVIKPHGTPVTYEADFMKNGKFNKELPHIKIDLQTEEAEIINVEDPTKAYDIYFVLSDDYGNVSSKICASEVIPIKEGAKEPIKIESVSMPNLEEETSVDEAMVTWTVNRPLEKDDKFIAVQGYTEYITTAEDINVGERTVQIPFSKFGLTNDLESMSYSVSVFAKGDSQTNPSNVAISNDVLVSPVDCVTDLLGIPTFENHTISWKDPANKENIGSFRIKAFEYDDKSQLVEGEGIEIKETPNKNDSGYTVDAKELKDDVIYEVTVEAVPKAGHKLSEGISMAVRSPKFFRLGAPTIVENNKSESSVELKLSEDSKNVSRLDDNYNVYVGLYNPELENYEDESSKFEPVTEYSNIKIDKDGKFKVDNLTENGKYMIALVVTGKWGQFCSNYVIVDKTR